MIVKKTMSFPHSHSIVDIKNYSIVVESIFLVWDYSQKTDFTSPMSTKHPYAH